jgi:hypothetical protein
MKFFLPVQDPQIAEESYQAIKKNIEKANRLTDIGHALLRDPLPRDAATAGAAIKKAYPIVVVTVVDTEEHTTEIINA